MLLLHPDAAADGVVEVTMMAVRPDLQGHGRGAALLRHAETLSTGAGARLVVVRTSGTSQYDGSRAFYRRCGYSQVAVVPDYWAEGDDLVIFTKRLRRAGETSTPRRGARAATTTAAPSTTTAPTRSPREVASTKD